MHRRRALSTLALGAAGTALPRTGRAQMVPELDKPEEPRPLVRPARLRRGQHVRLIAPAGAISANAVREARENMDRFGLSVSVGRHAQSRWGYFAGTDAARADDVMDAFTDPDVDAVATLRGGWGCARILRHLDFDAIRENAKVLTGFSDITALHLAIYARANVVSMHGPNGPSAFTSFTTEVFERTLFDAEAVILANPEEGAPSRSLLPGTASGRIVGGNLTVLAGLVGTPYLPSFDGHLLFLEDVGEDVYRIDRMLTHLSLSGALDGVTGVVFGSCRRCTAESDGFTLDEVLLQHVRPLGVPLLVDASFGHLREKWTLPLGIEADLDADAGTVRLLQAAVV